MSLMGPLWAIIHKTDVQLEKVGPNLFLPLAEVINDTTSSLQKHSGQQSNHWPGLL